MKNSWSASVFIASGLLFPLALPVAAATPTPVVKMHKKMHRSPMKKMMAVKARTARISIKNYQFKPETIKIKAGTTVIWKNTDIATHTITADQGAFSSPPVATDKTYSYTFKTAGTFSYHCEPHPYMKAKIVVTP